MTMWFIGGPRMRGAYGSRSTFAFYLLATAVLLLCSLVPMPMRHGHSFFNVGQRRTHCPTSSPLGRDVPIPIPLRPSSARFIQVRLDESHPRSLWVVADIGVRGRCNNRRPCLR